MKYLLVIITLYSGYSYSQCDSSYTFTSQGQIDSFRINHGRCDSVLNISIDDAYDIHNLDSLIDIEHITYLSLFLSDSSKLSLSGLNNLSSVRTASTSLYTNVHETLKGLQYIDTLFLGYRTKVSTLKLFTSVISINRLSISGDGPLDAMVNLVVDRNLDLSISQREGGFLSAIIPDTLTFINRLGLTGLKNFDIIDGINIDTIDKLAIGSLENVNLSKLTNAHILSNLGVTGADDKTAYHNGFVNVTSLKALNLTKVSFLEALSDIVPNLSSVDNFLRLLRNPLLNNIEPLAYLDIPEESDLSKTFHRDYITIGDNPNLNICDISYLCEALKAYPDEVAIYGNGPRCHRDTLLQQGCRTTSLDDIDVDNIQIFPNPTSETFTVHGFSGQYQILSTSGQIHLSGTIDDQKEINITRLTLSGPYFLRLIKDESVHIIPFIKNP